MKNRFQTFLKAKIAQNKSESANDKNIIKGLPFSVRRKLGLTGFTIALICFLLLFLVIFFSDFFSEKLMPQTKFYQVNSLNIPHSNQQSSTVLGNVNISASSLGNTILTNTENNPSQYLYDGKNYPKVAELMPVYHLGKPMISSNASTSFKKLKIGELSFRHFSDLVPSNFSVSESNPEGYNISFLNGRLNIYQAGKNSNCNADSCPKTTDKQIQKLVEKKLKTLGISLQNYGKPEITINTDNSFATIFYPFMLNGYPVYDNNAQFGMFISYYISDDMLTISNLDSFQYELANYPTIAKDEILADFTFGDKKINPPLLVYLAQDRGSERFFFPALKFNLSSGNPIFKVLVNL
ncbi:hypothetical protein AGMMS50249_4810 [candidate division SR1 bacterium]|nr:hypothetical protein AGMMS50249_4810 [candidate division SR1 bacterium]